MDLQMLLLSVLAFVAGMRTAHASCLDTEANCFAPTTNQAPFATATATETCGIELGTEMYSFGGLQIGGPIPPQSGFTCDASLPNFAHNVTSLNDGNVSSWWQGPHNRRVNALRLNWPNGFFMTSIAIEHRSVRPSRATLEYSTDNGLTWSVYNFYARNCRSPSNGFPLVPEVDINNLPQDTSTVCYEQESGTNPEDRGQVTFTPESRIGQSRFTNVTLIENYVVITNLRYDLSVLFTLSEVPENARGTEEAMRYYYGVYEWVVNGTCHCYGHSNNCTALAGDTPGFQSGCNCAHNTMGANCEQCLPLFNNRTWLPGTDTQANACEECNCNNHAVSCTFNAALGQGVCNNCTDNTVGNNCEACASNFFENMAVPRTDPNFCLPCGCDPIGTLENTACNSTGQCQCQANVINRPCSECADGFFNLTIDNQLGCEPCLCNEAGSENLICDKDNIGQCLCKANVHQRMCDQCMDGFFNLTADNPLGCLPCECDCGGSTTPICDKQTGQCMCVPFVTGRQCTRPVDQYYFPDFDWLRIEMEDFQLPMMAEIIRMENPFPANNFTGQGVVNFPAGANQALYPRPTRTIPTPGQYQGVTCLPTATNSQINPAVDPSQIALTITGPVTVDSCTLHVSPNLFIGTCLVGDIFLPTFSQPTLDLLTLCQNHRISQLTSCEQAFDPRCESITFTTMMDLWESALPCTCDGVGSSNNTCKQYGGQCFCQPNVQGRTCDECVPGFFGFSNTGCQPCECVVEGRVDNLCSPTDGQCNCLPNVAERDCRRCETNFFDFGNAAGCSPCECNPDFSTSLQCNNTGVCTCLPGVGGEKCTECLPGFHSIMPGIGCTPCTCDLRGTQEGRTCDNVTGLCPCKENTMNANCSECRPGTYGLSFTAPQGCFDCLCSNKSSECMAASGYRLSTFVENFENDVAGFVASDPSVGIAQNTGDGETFITSLITNLFPPLNPDIFYNAGAGEFLGDLSRSLGHRLTFTLLVQISTGAPNEVIVPLPAGTLIDVLRIETDLPGVSPIVAAIEAPMVDTAAEISIPLYTGDIMRVGSVNGPLATLQEIRAVLQRVTRLGIRMTGYVAPFPGQNFGSVTLFNVTLGRAVLSSDMSLPEVQSVEDCACPAAYMGLSCEQCRVDTHTRDFDLRGLTGTAENVFDVCVPCMCNSHSVSCSQIEGICNNCGDNTEGDHCENCSDMFFGDATTSVTACQPCACDMIGSANNSCNRMDGQCPCQPNIINRQCTECRNTTFGFSAAGCMSCGCNVNATMMNTCIGGQDGDCICSQVDGQCDCQDNVEGRTCTDCAFGTFGIAPACVVCHPCFELWFDIIQRLSVMVEFQDNRTTDALLRAFGGLSAMDIMDRLNQIRMKLDQSEARINERDDIELDGLLSTLESAYQTVLASFTSASTDIDQVEESLNFSLSRLPFIENFTGAVTVFDGTVITAEELDQLSRVQNMMAINVTSTANRENMLLQDVAAQANVSVQSARESQRIVAAALASAQSTLAGVPGLEALHAEYRALYQANEAYIGMSTTAVENLEAYSMNATSIITMAYQVVTAANSTAYMARVQAASRLVEAQQLAANVLSIAILANATYESAANGSRAASAVQAAAFDAYQRANTNLNELASINATLQGAYMSLQQARDAAQAVRDLQTPTVDDVELVRNLSEQINASIVPQSEIDRVLADARDALMQAEEILAVVQAAYNTSQIAYDMVAEIQTVLQQVTMYTENVNEYINRARTYIQQANDTLQQTRQAAYDLVSLTNELRDVVNNEARPDLEATLTCQSAVTNVLQEALATATRLCSIEGPILQSEVESAEANVAALQAQATARYSEVASTQDLVVNATQAADNVRAALDARPSASAVTALLTEYIQLQMEIQSSQTRAVMFESQLDSIVAAFEQLSLRCPA
ncbi:laminin subunit alpha-2-like [Sycon ciliatum]|uniref:laminin subunit alpha-2-like n=1 Tax=Sycon ciliatum TaxID=27933 RepID=UPI0031F673D8